VATITIGTAATTTLTGAVWHSNMAQADVRAINTALTAAVATLAGASGTPLITPTLLAQINAWNSGSP
jgi:hypothetical protein